MTWYRDRPRYWEECSETSPNIGSVTWKIKSHSKITRKNLPERSSTWTLLDHQTHPLNMKAARRQPSWECVIYVSIYTYNYVRTYIQIYIYIYILFLYTIYIYTLYWLIHTSRNGWWKQPLTQERLKALGVTPGASPNSARPTPASVASKVTPMTPIGQSPGWWWMQVEIIWGIHNVSTMYPAW